MGYDVNESLEATNVVVVSDFVEPPLFCSNWPKIKKIEYTSEPKPSESS